MDLLPNRAPRWERRKESRPAELLAAALEIFVERGFAAARLDDVAARAGVSKGTLYLYYSSKEELFKAVVRENIVPLIEQYRRDVEQSDATSDVLLSDFFHAWWSRFGATRLAGICKLVIGEAGNFPELARFFQEEVVLPNLQLLLTIAQRGVDRGEFKPMDVEAAVHLWMAPLVLRAIWSHSIGPCCPPGFELPIERVLSSHIAMILDGIRTRPRGAAGKSRS
jgi:TetR/AcrR family transcriptional regulator